MIEVINALVKVGPKPIGSAATEIAAIGTGIIIWKKTISTILTTTPIMIFAITIATFVNCQILFGWLP
jgi:hypothetical protein